jgi:hypothetical protein
MKELYIIVSDGTHCLYLDVGNGTFELPSHKQWPMTRKPSRNHWPISVLEHVTYGLHTWTTYERLRRPFDTMTASIVYFPVSDVSLKSLVAQCQTVYRWHYYYGPYEAPWKVKLAPLKDLVSKLDHTSFLALKALDQLDLERNVTYNPRSEDQNEEDRSSVLMSPTPIQTNDPT